MRNEILRQQWTINLIASENYASEAVLEALATPFVNKYSEGYPGKRYYPGNKYVDEIEACAIEKARKLFSLGRAWHVNVQPYSGSPANAAIYMALMNPGDTLMGMALSSGGHLTHGHSATFSGKIYRTVSYGIHPKTGLIDYEEVETLAKKQKPKVIISGFSAYPRKINFKKFGEIAKSIGAYHMADISHIAGLVVAGIHPPPFPYADVVMTTTHKTLRGPRGAVIFSNGNSKAAKHHGIDIASAIDKAVFPGIQGGPHENSIFAKAIAFEEALKPLFKKYQKQIIANASVLARELQEMGFMVLSGGTDTHLMLIDLKNFGIDGQAAEKLLEKVGITANRNSIPGDLKPFYPSGIRLGTPALTTRGMREGEMKKIAALIFQALTAKNTRAISEGVKALCKQFPIM